MDRKVKAMIQGVLAFPLPVLILIPGLLLYFTQGFRIVRGSDGPFFWVAAFSGISLITAGGVVVWETVTLFLKHGNGTPAPWEPPRNFVVLGPYRYVRNPMMLGVVAILGGEALLFGSAMIFVWLVFFLLVMNLFVIFYEEPGLAKRFGTDYLRYKRQVPRWIPRLKPYQEN